MQALLAIAYVATGFMKVSQPIESLATSMNWVRDVPLPFLRFIGVAEILGAIGLILPRATGIFPWLTVAAAVGLVVLQVSAAIFHISRGEFANLPVNVVLLILAGFVAYGRWSSAPAREGS